MPSQQTGREAAMHRDAIWLETVKYGDMPILVRAAGAVTTASSAELKVAASQATLVQIGQLANVDLRRAITITGEVTRVDSYVPGGTVTVVVELQAPAPNSGASRLRASSGFELLRTSSTSPVPTLPRRRGESALFKMESSGSHATRVKVRFEAQSVSSVQILDGLQPGDRVILSDTTRYNGFERILIE